MTRLLFAVLLFGGLAELFVAGWGYCWKCSCNRYEQPYGGGNLCRNCGHSYGDHYNVNRP